MTNTTMKQLLQASLTFLSKLWPMSTRYIHMSNHGTYSHKYSLPGELIHCPLTAESQHNFKPALVVKMVVGSRLFQEWSKFTNTNFTTINTCLNQYILVYISAHLMYLAIWPVKLNLHLIKWHLLTSCWK